MYGGVLGLMSLLRRAMCRRSVSVVLQLLILLIEFESNLLLRRRTDAVILTADRVMEAKLAV